MLSGDKHNNQLIDMTKPETDPEGWCWVFDYMNAEFESIIYGNGNIENPHPYDEGSTMKVKGRSRGRFW